MNEELELDWSFDSVAKDIQRTENTFKKYEKDTRFWRLSKNEAGDGTALIRLMLDKNGKKRTQPLYYYSLKRQGIDGKTKWYIANSPETIGLPCPAKEYFSALKSEGTTEALAMSEKFKRQTKYVTNIMVVKDPANPENEGKIFLWEFGTKMLDKVLAWITPSAEELAMGEVGKNLYDPLNGYNIKLKVKKQGDFPTYDGSEVSATPSAVCDSKESAINLIKTTTYALDEFIQPEFYESYEDLTGRFNRYVSNSSAPSQATAGESSVNSASRPTAEIEEPLVKPTATADASADDAWLDEL